MDNMTIGHLIAKIVIQSTYETYNVVNDSFLASKC